MSGPCPEEAVLLTISAGSAPPEVVEHAGACASCIRRLAASGSATTAELPEELRRLGGRYLLTRFLGAGGFGAVYEATDERLGRSVAVKVLSKLEPATLGRFRREVSALSAIRDPHVVPILDFAIEDDGAFVVMERLEGESLSSWLAREKRLEPEVALAITRQLLSGLRAVHHAGIAHRDVKPANVFVTRLTEVPYFVRLLDFGLAKPMQSDDVAITRTGTGVGTPAYMAPEQMFAGSTAPSVDLFAVGVVLFEMLTGELPHAGNRTKLLATVPAPAARAVEALLEPDPERRPRDAEAALALLQEPEPHERSHLPRVTVLAVLGVLGVVGIVAAFGLTTPGPVVAPSAPVGTEPSSSPSAAPMPSASITTPIVAVSSASQPATGPAAKSRCVCRWDRNGILPLCPAPQTPTCRCQASGIPLCPAEWEPGDACPRLDAAGGPGKSTGMACSGYELVYTGNVPKSVPETGALVCSVCDRAVVQAGVPGKRCSGIDGEGSKLDGIWDCR